MLKYLSQKCLNLSKCNVLSNYTVIDTTEIMKHIIFVLSICIINFSCQKEKEKSFQNTGIITGISPTQCPCVVTCPCVCGGFLFHFTDTSYSANIPLDNSGIFKLGADAHFPVHVKIDWQNTTRCGIVAIKVTDYKIL